MSLASYEMSIYTFEVDDHGIDFIAESKRGFLKLQVKAIRKGTGYVSMREEYFDISDQPLYLLLLLLNDDEHPTKCSIPATIWDNDNSSTFVYYSYEGKKSRPEYDPSISAKNILQPGRSKLENTVTAM